MKKTLYESHRLTGSINFLQAVLMCLTLKKDDIISKKGNTYLLGFIEIGKGQLF